MKCWKQLQRKKLICGTPWITFHITFTYTTLYDVDQWRVWLLNVYQLIVESNLSQVPEKSNKIFTRHLGDQILKFLSPTEQITHICKWVTGYLQPCLYQVKLDRLSIYIINYDVESVCENSQVLRVKYVQSLVLTKSYVQ